MLTEQTAEVRQVTCKNGSEGGLYVPLTTAMMSHVRLGAEVLIKSFGGDVFTGCFSDMHRRNICGIDGLK